MDNTTLQQAIFTSTAILNQYGQPFNPNPIALANDLSGPSHYSGIIALPSATQTKACGYELLKFYAPQQKALPTTFDELWACTKEHYGITAFAGLAGAASIPIPKSLLGHAVVAGTSRHTNIISHIGTRFFPQTRLPANTTVARAAKATFGTVRVFGIIGRAMPAIALGLAVIDIMVIGMCAYEARNGK